MNGVVCIKMSAEDYDVFIRRAQECGLQGVPPVCEYSEARQGDDEFFLVVSHENSEVDFSGFATRAIFVSMSNTRAFLQELGSFCNSDVHQKFDKDVNNSSYSTYEYHNSGATNYNRLSDNDKILGCLVCNEAIYASDKFWLMFGDVSSFERAKFGDNQKEPFNQISVVHQSCCCNIKKKIIDVLNNKDNSCILKEEL